MDFLRTYFYQNEPLTGMLQALLHAPLDFQTLQHPCLIS